MKFPWLHACMINYFNDNILFLGGEINEIIRRLFRIVSSRRGKVINYMKLAYANKAECVERVLSNVCHFVSLANEFSWWQISAKQFRFDVETRLKQTQLKENVTLIFIDWIFQSRTLTYSTEISSNVYLKHHL